VVVFQGRLVELVGAVPLLGGVRAVRAVTGRTMDSSKFLRVHSTASVKAVIALSLELVKPSLISE